MVFLKGLRLKHEISRLFLKFYGESFDMTFVASGCVLFSW